MKLSLPPFQRTRLEQTVDMFPVKVKLFSIYQHKIIDMFPVKVKLFSIYQHKIIGNND